MTPRIVFLCTALATSLIAPASARAELTTTEVLVHEAVHDLDLQLTADTVRCSSADYSAPVLKVLIPELAGMTLLDHQNAGAGAPCVAAGACISFDESPAFSPQMILRPNHPTAPVSITVRVFREETVDTDAKTCQVSIVERVSLNIRGVPFKHMRRIEAGERPLSDCQAP